jgi:Flp pilus assembly protein TadD
MYYFYACHYARLGSAAKQQEFLEKAIHADPAEVDTLIARHRLQSPSSAFRDQTKRLIDRAAAALRRRIEAAPENPSPYNQLAWLLGNTHGDLEEAARCAKKSLELSPNSGVFLDTLAHVYYAKGDFEQAVKYQTMAAEQEPNMGPIRRQLGVFREAWDAQRKSGGAAPAPAAKPAAPKPATPTATTLQAAAPAAASPPAAAGAAR